jgi:hypothetical protein
MSKRKLRARLAALEERIQRLEMGRDLDIPVRPWQPYVYPNPWFGIVRPSPVTSLGTTWSYTSKETAQ